MAEDSNQNGSVVQNPNEMAFVRTSLALDRTLLAWMRTSLTLVGFGFTLAKFVNDLLKHNLLPGMQSSYPRYVGFILMGLGLLALVAGSLEYVHFRRKLRPTGTVWTVTLGITAALVLLSVALMVCLAVELRA